jgi:hypothetical protein
MIFGRMLFLPQGEADNGTVSHHRARRLALPFLPPAALLLALGFLVLIPQAEKAATAKAGQSLALPGDRPVSSLPENADLRNLDWEAIFAARARDLPGTKAKILENGWGSWKRQVIASGPYVYLVYAAGRAGSYPLYSQGTWIVKRNLGSGAFLQAKIFLKSDPGTFVRLFPDGDRTRMDLVIYGGVYREDVPLPWSFGDLLKLRLGDIVEATRDSVDWSLFDPDPVDYRVVASLASSIRSRLSGLRYLDDGGLDGAGKLVFIATGAPQLPENGAAAPSGLNCSGFSQWVVDGLVKPLTGAWLDCRELAVKHLDTRKSAASASFEDSLDPYFGLDWTRNLASAARRIIEDRPEDPNLGIRAADITDAPFALLASGRDPVNGGRDYLDFGAYTEDAGFGTEGLPALLYELAVKDPGYFYLASISKQDKAGLRHHYHIAVLLPWFDDSGAFHVDVFESAAETSLSALVTRTAGQMAHLVRVKAARAFDPPVLASTRPK